ncbi:MAG: hypothetical protein WCK74_11075 [Gemmatimonadaceae bacterium]
MFPRTRSFEMSHRATRSLKRVICQVGLTLLTAVPVAAQSPPPAQVLLTGPFVINLGAFLFGTDVKAHLNGQSATNPDVNFRDTFGTARDATRWRADALWRMTPTQHLRVLYFDNRSSSARVLTKNVSWGDYTFQAGSNVSAENRFNILELGYEYAFLRRPTVEVAGTVGIHYMRLGLKLAGAATVTNGQGTVSQPAFSTKVANLPAPLPVLGVRAGWMIAPTWFVEGQGQFLEVGFGGIKGHVLDLRAGTNWMFRPGWGLGLGYNHFGAGVTLTKSSFDGGLRMGYGGVQLNLIRAF